MSCSTGPEIVNDDLVFHIDAANSKSYPGSGTTWYDLSGLGHHATLINSPVYSQNFFSFNGSTSRASFNFNPSLPYFYSQSFTLEALARQTAVSSTDGWLFDIDYVGYRLWGLTNTPFTVRGPATTWEASTVYPFVIGNWYHVCATMIDNGSANNVNVYINGQLFSTHSFTLKNIGPYGGISSGAIASHYAGTSPKPFDISYVRKYNRVLTANEVFQNFAAVRGRYGI